MSAGMGSGAKYFFFFLSQLSEREMFPRLDCPGARYSDATEVVPVPVLGVGTQLQTPPGVCAISPPLVAVPVPRDQRHEQQGIERVALPPLGRDPRVWKKNEVLDRGIPQVTELAVRRPR